MRRFRHKLEGRQKVAGFVEGEKSVRIGYFKAFKVFGECTHVHERSDEFYITARGKGTIWVNGKIMRLRPGMPLKVERGEPHRLLSVYEGPLELYVIKVPDEFDDKKRVETPKELKELMERHKLLL